MRKKIVAGNWKMNKTLPEGIQLAEEVNEKVKALQVPEVKVILGTPFIHLAEVSKLVPPLYPFLLKIVPQKLPGLIREKYLPLW